MARRRFLLTSLAGALAAPLAAAQHPEKLYRIGVLERTSPAIMLPTSNEAIQRHPRDSCYIRAVA